MLLEKLPGIAQQKRHILLIMSAIGPEQNIGPSDGAAAENVVQSIDKYAEWYMG